MGQDLNLGNGMGNEEKFGDNLFESLPFNNFNSDLRVFSGTMEKFASGRKRKLPENEIE